MKLTFLGTSAGKPTIERNVSALGLELEQESGWYLFDCGEGTQRQIMKSRLSMGKLSTIFITHLHGDHYYGLPGLLSTKKLEVLENPITIYAPKGIKKFLECAMDISKSNLGYLLNIIEYRVQDEFIFDRFIIKVLPLVHSKDSVAFHIKENDTGDRLDENKLRQIGLEPSPLYGELKKGKTITHNGEVLNPKEFMLDTLEGRRIIIAGDNSEPEVIGEYLKNIDLLVHECTFTQEVFDNMKIRTLHTTAKALGITAEKWGVANLIANHINPRYNTNSNLNEDMIYDEIKENYTKELFLAKDFDVYYLNKDKSISKS